jgi:hypothetical protein
MLAQSTTPSLSFEIQGVMYAEQDYRALREIEEREARNFTKEYQERMYADWVKEPTLDDLRMILQNYKRTLAKHGQTIDGVLNKKPFSAARYLEVMQILRDVTEMKLNQGTSICPICFTPLVLNKPVHGKNDTGMRCAINRFHLMANMAVEMMTPEQLNHVFAETWLAHVINREPISLESVKREPVAKHKFRD